MHDKLTKADIRKMQEEIDYRKLVVRKQALKDLKEAAAQGDRSENFEYYAAKRFNGQNNSRIRYLENMIRTAIIIEDDTKENEAGLGKRITLRFDGEEEVEIFKLVTAVRGNSLKGLITIDSPLGKALLRHKAGERVFVRLENGGGYEVEIVEIAEADGIEEELRKF